MGPTVKTLTVAVAGEVTAYSESVSLKYAQYFGLGYKVAGTTQNIKIELEQSHTLPATEGSSDANYVVPENMAAIEAGVTDTNLHITNFSPRVMPYCRFKLTGLSGNSADIVVTLYIAIQDIY